MKKYTRLFEDGQAYITIYKVQLSSSGTEITGEPIRQLALYESSGYEPAEILIKLRELEAYQKTGFTPEQFAQVFKGLPVSKECGCPGQLTLADRGA